MWQPQIKTKGNTVEHKLQEKTPSESNITKTKLGTGTWFRKTLRIFSIPKITHWLDGKYDSLYAISVL